MDAWSDVGNIRRQRSCQNPGIGDWWSSSLRHTTTAGLEHYGRCELFDDDDDAAYHQMEAGGGPDRRRRRRRGWVGRAWKRLLRKKWKLLLFEPTKVSARDCPGLYDAETYAQNFDAGDSFRLEPENLSRSFSAQFANPSGFLQRRRI